MTLFKRTVRPVHIVLAACLFLFLWESVQLAALEREAAPAMGELNPARRNATLATFIHEYMGDPFGRAIGLDARQLQLCQRVSLMVPAYESASAWRSNAFFIGFFTLLSLGLKRYAAPIQRWLNARGYRGTALRFLRRMAIFAGPVISKIQQRMGRRNAGATPHAVHSIISCPSCPQKLRIPAGKGRIRITCTECGTKFECVT